MTLSSILSAHHPHLWPLGPLGRPAQYCAQGLRDPPQLTQLQTVKTLALRPQPGILSFGPDQSVRVYLLRHLGSGAPGHRIRHAWIVVELCMFIKEEGSLRAGVNYRTGTGPRPKTPGL